MSTQPANPSRQTAYFLILIFVMGVFMIITPKSAHAAAFTNAYIRLDRIKASTTTGGTVCATPASTNTEADVQIAFPTGFTVNGTASNWTVTTTNLPNGATAWPGIGTASAVSSQTVTFPSTTLTASTLYCFNFTGTSTLTNPTAGDSKTGTITTRTAGTATIDTSTYALSIISDDQISITGTVPAIFTLALSGNTDNFSSNLSTSSVVSNTGVTLTIGTNAQAGWVAWVKSANAGLLSATTSETIATAGSVDNSPTDLSATTGYVLDVDITTDSGTGDGTVSQASNWGAEYAGANTNSGGTLSTSLQPIAASNGTTDADVLTLTARAKISAVTAAATDYTDTLTVVAAARF